jgi:hypothetical protein
MKVVLNRRLPPVGPFLFPTDCNKRHGIEPLFGQLAGSEPALIPFALTAHTRLLSRELCHVAFPLRGGTMPGFGLSLMLWKCVMIWNCTPKRSANRVASGRAVGFQAAPPVLVGRQV